jgi:hypothetical protein
MHWVASEIADAVNPHRIILYHKKTGAKGEISSFKMCIIGDFDDKMSVEHNIYLAVDCHIPFDVVIYTPAEWDELLTDSGSFASRIADDGEVVYSS